MLLSLKDTDLMVLLGKNKVCVCTLARLSTGVTDQTGSCVGRKQRPLCEQSESHLYLLVGHPSVFLEIC